MKVLLKLTPKSIKPVIKVNKYSEALFDTGADIPVWVNSLNYLLLEFPDAEFVTKDYCISGFGGQCSGQVYTINFTLDSFTFPHMPIFVPDVVPDFPYSLILPAAIFDGLLYSIDTSNKHIAVDVDFPYQMVRNIKIMKSDGTIVVLAD